MGSGVASFSLYGYGEYYSDYTLLFESVIEMLTAARRVCLTMLFDFDLLRFARHVIVMCLFVRLILDGCTGIYKSSCTASNVSLQHHDHSLTSLACVHVDAFSRTLPREDVVTIIGIGGNSQFAVQ